MTPQDKSQQAVAKSLGRFGEVVWPEDAAAPILSAPVRQVLHGWLYELNYEHELAAVGVKPRQRVMLSGPPGCGKTTLAHHVAARLGIPMLVMQAGAVISKYVGETESRIDAMFRAARDLGDGSVALFLDELDSIAHARIDAQTSAGVGYNNIALVLLQSIDRYRGLLFGATNRADGIDPAVWRRFQLQITIDFPGPAERAALVRQYLTPFSVDDDTVDLLADLFDQASAALIRESMEQIKRDIVLAPRLNIAVQLPALLRRQLASIRPAPDQPLPALWGAQAERLLQRAAFAAWPPVRGDAA